MISQNEVYQIVNYEFWEKGSTLSLPPDIPLECVSVVLRGRALTWINAYDWLIKLEWNSKHEIKLPYQVKSALKAQGELLSRYLRLCERCHSISGFCNIALTQYPTAAHWFSQIYREIMYLTVLEDIAQKEIEFHDESKRNIINLERRKLAAIKNNQNPFETNLYIENLTSFVPEMFKLLAFSGQLAQHLDQFKKNYWNPFLDAYANWIQEMEHPRWRTLKTENGKFYLIGSKRDKKPNVCLGDLGQCELQQTEKWGRKLEILGGFPYVNRLP